MNGNKERDFSLHKNRMLLSNILFLYKQDNGD